MSDDTKKQLQSQLWNIANTLRGKMGADEFRDYILGFIFYKYLSERMHLFADEILQHDGVKFDEIDEATPDGQEMLDAIKTESVGRLGYFLKPSELFHQLALKGAQKSGNFILEDLTAVLKHIEASTMGHDSEDDFEGLFEDIYLGSSKLGKTENQKNELIAKVLVHLDQIDFRLADTEADVLGEAYEYLIGQFASGAGKKAGEFYTPQQVSTILARIVTTGKKSLKNVYDPTFGSGSLLLRVAKELPEGELIHFYGQEMNPTTYNLARMNMILHGVHYQRFDLKNEDTLEHPAPEHADLRFDAIVANPPFSAKWSASAIHENDDRFSAYGKLAPKTKADFAFVQHMVHHLDDGGTMACVLPHGVLFRGAAEGHIRRYLIHDCNYLDAVIGLPSNIFYGTGIPTCILVLKKQRENPDDILFIDASQGFEKVGNQNELRPEHIDRIIDTFRERKSIEKFSHVADLSEVAENDYNLNIPRYVDTFDEEEPVDLDEVVSNLAVVEKAGTDADKAIAESCEELGLPFPSGHNASLLQIYKKGVMQQLFTQALRFKDDHGNDFPDWEEKKLGDTVTVNPKTSDLPDSFIYIDLESVVAGVLHSQRRISREGAPSRAQRLLQRGDILFQTVRPYQMNNYLYDLDDLHVASTGYAQLRASTNNPRFIYYSLHLPRFVGDVMDRCTGTSYPAINSKVLGEIEISIPSLAEQTKIANFLTALDRKIESVSQQITHTQTFKRGLLQQMFV